MQGRIDWSELFFSAGGRSPRTPFLIAVVALFLLLTLYQSLVYDNGPMHWLTGVPVYGALLFMSCCVLSKRFHDRGRSGWWAAPVLLAFALVWPRPDSFWDFISVVFLIWAVVELCLMPGEQGFNRHGPNPLRGPQGEATA
jgi:uncharacterized membrane protein YhaH (DUF805 family)